MEDREDDLRNDMLGRNKIDIVDVSYILQLDVPVPKLFRCQIKTVSLVGDIMVLTEDTTKVTSRKEYSTGTIVSLYAWLCK